MESDGSAVTAKNTYGGPLLLRTVFGEEETTYQYLYNAHGDVVTLLSDGEVVATYYYDSFGNILDQTGNVDNSILYAGYQYDEETGLYYLNARMYDPVTARFLQADTYLGNLNDPLSLNLYTYCLNNPHKYVDPSGHVPVIVFILGAVVWGLVAAGVEYKQQEKAGGIIDLNQVIFHGTLNTAINLISGGSASYLLAGGMSFGQMMMLEAGLGVAEGIIGETGHQLIGGTKVKDLDVGQIATSGVMGGFSGAGGALIGEGVGAGLKSLRNTRIVSKAVDGVTGQVTKYANILKGSSQSYGIINGKTPASRLADKLRGLSNAKRPNTVAVIRTTEGRYYMGYNSAGFYNKRTQDVLDELGNVNGFKRQCAEVNAVSRALEKGANVNKATISVAHVRGLNNKSGLHGTYKAPCDVCQPLLDYFNITDIH